MQWWVSLYWRWWVVGVKDMLHLFAQISIRGGTDKLSILSDVMWMRSRYFLISVIQPSMLEANVDDNTELELNFSVGEKHIPFNR